MLFVGINYPPEHTGIAPYTGAMCDALAQEGFDISVVTALPHYPDWRVWEGAEVGTSVDSASGVTQTRVTHFVPNPPKGVKRLLSEVSFGFASITAGWGRPDVIVLVSPAMVSSALGMAKARLMHRNAPVVVWVQDLYGKGLAETGRGGLVQKIISGIEGWLLRHATAVVVIHERFGQIIASEYGVSPESIQVIPNWSHVAELASGDSPKPVAGHRTVLHTGNMGVKQGLHLVVEAANLRKPHQSHIRFVLMGQGGERPTIERMAQNVAGVLVMDAVPSEDYLATLMAADILLVHELPGVSEMAVPSKLTSYFASGRPVIAATDPNGITAQVVRAAGAGLVVESGNAEALLEAIETLLGDAVLAHQLGENGRRYARENLTQSAAVANFSNLLEQLPSQNPANR